MPELSQVEQTRRTAARWLLSQQHGESYGWSDTRSRYVNTMNTAEGILGLLEANVVQISLDRPLQSAAQYLESQQVTVGENCGCWVRDVYRDDRTISHVPDVVRTATALEALLRAGRSPATRSVLAGLDWLRAVVAPISGGWGYAPNARPVLLPTTKALRALVEAKRRGWPDPTDLLQKQLAAILNQRQPNGSFGDDSRLTAVNTIGVGLLLQKARLYNIWTDLDAEFCAIDWIKNSPDAAVSPVVELIELDSSLPDATYEFIHIPDALTLQLLAGSVRDNDLDCPAFVAAQLNLAARIDPTGGVFGYRTYTWATAHALSAMSAMIARGITDFPTRDPHPSTTLSADLTAPTATASTQPVWRSTKEQVIAVLVIFVITAAFGTLAFILGGPAFGLPLVAYFMCLFAGALLLIGRLSDQSFTDVAKSYFGNIRQ